MIEKRRFCDKCKKAINADYEKNVSIGLYVKHAADEWTGKVEDDEIWEIHKHELCQDCAAELDKSLGGYDEVL